MPTVDVKTTKTRTVTESITVCDKCGLEADDHIPLYDSLERQLVSNPSDVPLKYDAMVRSRTRLDHNTMMLSISPETAAVIERTPDPLVRVCQSCYDEMFGWTADTGGDDE